MRTIIPGSVSPAYLKALRDTQVDFVKSITMSDERAAEVRERELNGLNFKEYKGPTGPSKV